MTFEHKLRYAGEKPYQPEVSRVEDDDDPMTYQEFEMLSQDKTYRRLAQLRWLVRELESDCCADSDVPEVTKDALFEAVNLGGSPLTVAVDQFIRVWLEEHREKWDEPHGPSDDGSDAVKEENA